MEEIKKLQAQHTYKDFMLDQNRILIEALSKARGPQPFAEQDQIRFLEALDRVQNDLPAGTNEWDYIARFVGRSIHDCKHFAHRYSLALHEDPDITLLPEGSENTPPCEWSVRDEFTFEQALIDFPEGVPARWNKIGTRIGKSSELAKEHYIKLQEDLMAIEAGEEPATLFPNLELVYYKGQPANKRSKHTKPNGDRRKGVPWTEEEHRLFLQGLEQHGKGDWRNIATNYVTSRTPTQVASHAQKYFIRQMASPKDLRPMHAGGGAGSSSEGLNQVTAAEIDALDDLDSHELNASLGLGLDGLAGNDLMDENELSSMLAYSK